VIVFPIAGWKKCCSIRSQNLIDTVSIEKLHEEMFRKFPPSFLQNHTFDAGKVLQGDGTPKAE
jgi:hypothetical protein